MIDLTTLLQNMVMNFTSCFFKEFSKISALFPSFYITQKGYYPSKKRLKIEGDEIADAERMENRKNGIDRFLTA